MLRMIYRGGLCMYFFCLIAVTSSDVITLIKGSNMLHKYAKKTGFFEYCVKYLI